MSTTHRRASEGLLAGLGTFGAGYRRPRHRQMLTLTVQGQERISPNFVSVTLGGHDVRHLAYTGFDQSGRLFFAEPGHTEVVLPSSEKWMLQQSLQSAKRRPR